MLSTKTKAASALGMGEDEFLVRLLSAVPATMLSVVAGNPWDVLKVRYQRGKAVKGTNGLASGDPRTVLALVRREGVFRGLYAGFWPNVFRNSIVGSSEMLAYSQFKRLLVTKAEFDEHDATTHLTSALGAGLTAAVLGSPMDVLGTRMMQPEAVESGKGFVRYGMDMLQKEGPASFCEV